MTPCPGLAGYVSQTGEHLGGKQARAHRRVETSVYTYIECALASLFGRWTGTVIGLVLA